MICINKILHFFALKKKKIIRNWLFIQFTVTVADLLLKTHSRFF